MISTESIIYQIFMFQIFNLNVHCSNNHRIYNYESWFIIDEEVYMHVWCDYEIYIYSTPEVPNEPFSKIGIPVPIPVPVPIPIPKFPRNLDLNLFIVFIFKSYLYWFSFFTTSPSPQNSRILNTCPFIASLFILSETFYELSNKSW